MKARIYWTLFLIVSFLCITLLSSTPALTVAHKADLITRYHTEVSGSDIGNNLAFHNQSILAPECWDLQESISFSEDLSIEQLQSIQRVSIYEIHDDDSVNPNHELTGLPYFNTFGWHGSADVEWLVLDGNFSSYEINPETHSVTFYDLQDWLRVVYRTRNFVERTTDQIQFCVIGQNANLYWPTEVKVLYPANYQLESAVPAGYSVPAPGEVFWDFGTITEFQVEAHFSGLGPDRPLLDLPVDYLGRGAYSSIGFTQALNLRTTSMFDHRYPNYSRDGYFLSYTGAELPDPHDIACTRGFNCYDGHDGYDFDDICPLSAPCSDPSAVYPAADGEIINAGWLGNILGCQIIIDHGNNWTTLYAHLQDVNDNRSCDGILRWSGAVTSYEQIGIIGESGSGAEGTHLHFVVRHNNVVVDPSGWEPNAISHPDPWASHPNGAASYPMWLYSLRTTQAFDPGSGGLLTSPTHRVRAVVPAGFHTEQLTFNLSNMPVSGLFRELLSTGNSFSLTTADVAGNFVNQLDQPITLEVTFDITNTLEVNPDSIQLYFWDENIGQWSALATIVDWNSHTATAQVNHLSIFALMGETKNIVYLPMIRND